MESKLCCDPLYGHCDCQFCRQYFVVSIVAQLLVPMHLDTYMLYMNESRLLCTIQIHVGLQETHCLAVFWVPIRR